MKASEPRAHHFAPQCWLAGFTDNGTKSGRLRVTDLELKKQWPTTPPNAGHQRDFYRISQPGQDPGLFEKQFGKIESEIAPLLSSLYAKPRCLTPDEIASLQIFMALQYVRVPAFRPTILKMAERIHHRFLMKNLKSPKTTAKARQRSDVPPDAEGVSYEGMLEFVRGKHYKFSAHNEFFLVRGFKAAADAIIPALQTRHWGTMISGTGSFIGSDNPVTFDGPKGKWSGF
jgi:hypothetical protein